MLAETKNHEKLNLHLFTLVIYQLHFIQIEEFVRKICKKKHS